MEIVSNTITVSLPNYLSNLPVPNSIGGIFRLSVKDWIRLVPFIGTVSFFSWVTYTRFFQPRDTIVNPGIDKDSSKVVHAFDIEDIGSSNKLSLCRCWRSNKFPLCDGSHNEHNKETGDNVGPVIIKRKE